VTTGEESLGAKGARGASRFRQRYEDESRQPWLVRLLDSLAVIDAGIEQTLQRERAAGRRLACSMGCAHCCRNHLIPVTPLEVEGICWFVLTQLKGVRRSDVLHSLEAWQAAAQQQRVCAFNVRDVCTVYPLRPVACRQFHVFREACVAGEDVFAVRPEDVLRPPGAYRREADRLQLPHYGFATAEAVEQALEGKYLRSVSQSLLDCDWGRLLRAMRGRG